MQVIQPGVGVLGCEVQGIQHKASLLENGDIEFEGMCWSEVSTFVASVKNLRASGRNPHSMWKDVMYKGHGLDCYSTGKFVDPSEENKSPDQEEGKKKALEKGKEEGAGGKPKAEAAKLKGAHKAKPLNPNSTKSKVHSFSGDVGAG